MKNKRIKYYIRFIKEIFIENKLNTIASGIIATVIVIISLVQPTIIKNIIDECKLEGSKSRLIIGVTTYLVVSYMNVFLQISQDKINSKIRNKVEISMKNTILFGLSKGNLLKVSTLDKGEILKVMEDDIANVEGAGIETLFQIIKNIVIMLVSGIILFRQSWILFVLVLIGELGNLYIQYNLINKQEIEINKIRSGEGKLFSKINEYVSTIENAYISKYDQIFLKKVLKFETFLKNKKIDVDIRNTKITGVEVGIYDTIIILIYLICGLYAIVGKVSIGMIVALIEYVNLFMGPISMLCTIGIKMTRINVSLARIYNLKDFLKDSKPANLSKCCGIKTIKVKNLSFTYDGKSYIFRNVDMGFERGKIYGIEGKNGIGKSTFLKVLCGIYKKTNGEVLINNLDVDKYDNESIRNHISYMPQECILYDGTLEDNIKSFSNISTKQYRKLINEMIPYCCKQKEKVIYENEVGQYGNNLSGGQRQIVSFIRTIANNGDVLIFDEPTAALDEKKRKKIIYILKKYCFNKIIIFVTHDKEIKKCVDVLYTI